MTPQNITDSVKNSVNELHPELLSVIALNSLMAHDSSARSQMYGSHLGQMLVLMGSEEKFIQSGMEQEYGKYTFNIKMPVDGTIVKVIQKYKPGVGKDSISHNPVTTVIYENDLTKEIGVFHIPDYCSYHQYFGFAYKHKSATNKLIPGMKIAKGEIFADSPSIGDNGAYKYGTNVNMVFMSHPSVAEDGIMICSDVLHKFKFKTYESRKVQWGTNSFPLNIYGNTLSPSGFKAFPEIGEYVREDGLLMALRGYDRNLAPVEQSIYDLAEMDPFFDKPTYAAGKGGKIIDIRVHTGENSGNNTLLHMDDQIQRYVNSNSVYYQTILSEYKRLSRERKDALCITPEFHNLVIDALAVLEKDVKPILNKVYRKAPLDDYHVEFIIEYETVPTEGFKLTDEHGGLISIQKL